MSLLERFAKQVQDNSLSYISGCIDSPHSYLKIYTSNGFQLPFPFPTNVELQSLYDSAQLASFGRGTETVHDPSYRSARTFHTEDFSINLRPEPSLLHQIKTLMLKNDNSNDYVRAELYRVNVYGPGDFFKLHKDTPQTDRGHFGSLVMCLPTEFEGGVFGLRNPKGEEFKFDWGSIYAEEVAKKSVEAEVVTEEPAMKKTRSSADKTSVRYLAFASDMDHWIEPVTSGYRVTVTFHLYRETVNGTNAVEPLLKQMENTLYKQMLELKASNKLSGRKVVFPVVHQYSGRSQDEVVLQGGDATLFHFLTILELKPKIMFYYASSDYHDYEEDSDNNSNDDSDDNSSSLTGEYSVVETYLTDDIQLSDETGLWENCSASLKAFASKERVIWARNSTLSDQPLSVAGNYGNEASMVEYKGNVCIFCKW